MSRLKKKNAPTKKRQRRKFTRRNLLLIGIPLLLALLTGIFLFYRQDIAYWQYKTYRDFAHLTKTRGFTIENVLMSGRKETSQKNILQSLNVPLHAPMALFDIEKTAQNLQALPWVKKARIERHLPDTLLIHLTERQPLALWQHDHSIYLVDQEGYIIRTQNLQAFNHLPSIKGKQAPKQLPKLFKFLAPFPNLQKKIVSASWVGNRRWNLYLNNKITLMLPESNVVEALARFRKYENSHQVIKQARKRIDLRIPKRIIVD